MGPESPWKVHRPPPLMVISGVLNQALKLKRLINLLKAKPLKVIPYAFRDSPKL